ETALGYRDEQRALRRERDEDDAVSFTLLALSAIEDPGLLVLPTHRILHDLDPQRVAELGEQMSRYFAVSALDAAGVDATVVALTEAGKSGSIAFVLAGPNGLLLLRLLPAGQQAMTQLPAEHANTSPAWRALDLAILHELVLRRGLGITD